jgi:hypothetical protein
VGGFGLEVLDLADNEPETLLDLFAAQGWGDGLPLVAPTHERVDAMLADVADPDEMLGVIHPRRGMLTPRVIAVNAVLAGCPQLVMPVLVGVGRVLAGGVLDFAAVNPTTHPVAPLVIVHGDAVERCGFNAGAGTLGPGCRSNATVGRAVRFLLIHVGGAIPGSGDLSTHGQPSKYSFCTAENAAASPWGGYPASLGINTLSAVTVAAVENPMNVHDMESERPEGILDKIASNMASLGSNHIVLGGSEIFVALGPEHATTIADARWTRQDVAHYLYERARLPGHVVRAAFRNRRDARWMRALRDDELVPITDDPGKIRIFVTGGAGKHSLVFPSFGLRPTSVTIGLETHDVAAGGGRDLNT